MKVISADFVTSAAAGGSGAGVPRDGLPQVAIAGRSNVGKSTLINALSRRQVARTSAAPGKTRLANVYRLSVEGGGPGRWDLYLVDLPGYGYARGGADAAKELALVAEGYFRDSGFGTREPELDTRDSGLGTRDSEKTTERTEPRAPGRERRRLGPEPRTRSSAQQSQCVALLLVDSRHPGLESDIQAHAWLKTRGVEPLVIATKIDKLSRADRARNLKELGRILGTAALPLSAERGEGLDELWTRLARTVRGTKERR